MKKITDILFSSKLMALVLIIFAVSIGIATFIESAHGSETAHTVVYSSWWFILLLFIGIVNLTGSIFIKKLYRKEKATIFIFHLAFVFILAGAAITHFLGSEGFMHIHEGETSNQIVSSQTYLTATASDMKNSAYTDKSILLSDFSSNRENLTLHLSGKTVAIRCEKIIPNAIEKISDDAHGHMLLELVVAAENGRQTIILAENQPREIGGITFSLNDVSNTNGVNFIFDNSQLQFTSAVKTDVTEMASQSSSALISGEVHPFALLTLYNFGGVQIVGKKFTTKGKTEIVRSSEPRGINSEDALQLQVSTGSKTQSLVYFAKHNSLNNPVNISLDGLQIKVSFGAKVISLPFALELKHFTLEHYPGSNSPSSFESKIVLKDADKKLEEEHRIFMNNVLKYQGYRFYQSSYDMDEKGTILSVNHDFWGTFVTYLGYLLLALGIVASLFNKNSRFRKISSELSQLREARKALLVAMLICSAALFNNFNVNAQYTLPDNLIIDKTKAAEFGELLIQDQGGRIKPINTLSSELLRKIARTDKFEGQTSDQVFLGMMAYPENWQKVPMIKITEPGIKKVLQIEGSYAAFIDFIDNSKSQPTYKLLSYVNDAFQKKPINRSKFETEVIRVDERVNLCYLIYTGELLRIFPKPNDPGKTWYSITTAKNAFSGKDSLFVNNILPFYFQQLKAGGYDSIKSLNVLHEFQNRYGNEIMPTQFKIKAEIFYNRIDIFERLGNLYGLIGFILLVLQFITIFKPNVKIKPLVKVATILLVACFGCHLFGLILRWYISGHAPWSNAYESLVYIAFATMLAGIIFSGKSGVTLSATAIMAWLILFVAHLNWMDPEVTNLVPVLKSYWLLVHVAIITASYGFLGLGALLAVINLLLMSFQGQKDYKTSSLLITELTLIIEMTLIIGLYAITIGTFLGGVWANESWGRYWGWDSKETWALVTVLVYAFVAHMRMVPGLKGHYLFNLMALLGFSSVIMTYFGVNYYLTGLHSYAKGEAAPFPLWGFVAILVIAIVGSWAGINQKLLKQKVQE